MKIAIDPDPGMPNKALGQATALFGVIGALWPGVTPQSAPDCDLSLAVCTV
jgi:hypothetical protein